MALLATLKLPKNLIFFTGVSLLLFDLSYYLMSVLPGSRNSMCVVGANLTPLNIVFSLVMSILAGLMMVAVMSLAGSRIRRDKAALGSLSGVGFLIGLFSVFCPACSFPVLTLLGVSVGMEFISEHQLLFKGVGFVALLMGLYLLESQLKGECKICKN